MFYTRIKILILSLLFLNGIVLYSYTVYNTCPDFTNITDASVVANYGSIMTDSVSPFDNEGILSWRHTVVSTAGTDPNTGDALQILPAGETQVVKLGNAYAGWEAEALTYHFIVDEEKSILQVKFAVVFEDPGHPHDDQPRFRIRIMDKDGELLGDCSEYDVTSSSGLTGFQTYEGGTTPIHWRDWTTLVLDMSRLAGEEVQVEFTTYDCGWGAHFGYAYFTANCMKNQLSLQACTGSSVTAVAPDGYASYLWDNGDITQASTRVLTGSAMSISCLVTTELGCYYTINGYITDSIPVTESAVINDTICEGDAYLENNFNLPPQYELGNFSYYNTYMNSTTCEDDITVTLKLYVQPRFNHLTASICIGESYTANGFDIQNPPVGLHNDTLVIPRAGTCDSVVYLALSVHSSFSSIPAIIGDEVACVGDEMLYTLGLNDSTATYEWQVPSSASISYGQGTYVVAVKFNTTVGGQISVLAQNGCGSQNLSLDVKANPSYNAYLKDTICTGYSYNQNGFSLPIQDSVGTFLFVNRLQTVLGCDSTTVLELKVNPTPTLDVALLRDSFICAGDSVSLNAIGAGAVYNISTLPKVIVGDILCTDSTTETLSSFPTSGKTAKAIVYYVDTTGEHGWAVNLSDLSTTKRFSTLSVDLIGLDNFLSPASNFLLDLDGYTNTYTIRQAGTYSTYPAAYAVDFDNGWYLPSIGQLKMICTHSFMIEPSFLIAGGSMLDYTKIYVSSTEYDADFFWVFVYDGNYYYSKKTWYNSVRAVCSF